MGQCVICQTSIKPFISFGKQPIANGFLRKEQTNDEYFFELKVSFCPKCTMVQLEDQPKPEQMFNENYAFFSGTSQYMAVHFAKFADHIKDTYLKNARDPFVVEIGSNDGIMLHNFADAGYRHLGVEPSANVAEVARSKGIRTISEFFGVDTAKRIVTENGQADAFLAANVMCHIPDMHSVVEGIRTLLKPSGVAAFEDPYLGDVIEKTSYDQIYDEHMFLFSLSSIKYLFEQHAMELIDIMPQATHGGSMRYIIGHKGQHQVSARVGEQLAKEKALGLDRAATYETFRKNCESSKEELVKLLTTLKAEKKRVIGYAATSKSTTVLNYCGIGPDLVEFISDTTPIKQGKLSPGMHIPVLAANKFTDEYPDYALLFGWNHKAEIFAKEKAFVEKGGRWIVYVPHVEVLQQ